MKCHVAIMICVAVSLLLAAGFAATPTKMEKKTMPPAATLYGSRGGELLHDIGSSGHRPVPLINCFKCNGSGRCQICGGTGIRTIGGAQQQCLACSGTGV